MRIHTPLIQCAALVLEFKVPFESVGRAEIRAGPKGRRCHTLTRMMEFSNKPFLLHGEGEADLAATLPVWVDAALRGIQSCLRVTWEDEKELACADINFSRLNISHAPRSFG